MSILKIAIVSKVLDSRIFSIFPPYCLDLKISNSKEDVNTFINIYVFMLRSTGNFK